MAGSDILAIARQTPYYQDVFFLANETAFQQVPKVQDATELRSPFLFHGTNVVGFNLKGIAANSRKKSSDQMNAIRC